MTIGEQGLKEKGSQDNLPVTDTGNWVGNAATNCEGVNNSDVNTSAREACDMSKRNWVAECTNGS